MNRDLLEIQIDVLRKVTAEQLPFNMDSWISEGECGTACCALGWAALDPRMRAAGLRLVAWRPGYRREIASSNDYGILPQDKIWSIYPEYEKHRGFGAVASFYGISHQLAGRLFDPDQYNDEGPITPERVIARIEEMLADDAKGSPT